MSSKVCSTSEHLTTAYQFLVDLIHSDISPAFSTFADYSTKSDNVLCHGINGIERLGTDLWVKAREDSLLKILESVRQETHQIFHGLLSPFGSQNLLTERKTKVKSLSI